jgi:hypothetical protein
MRGFPGFQNITSELTLEEGKPFERAGRKAIGLSPSGIRLRGCRAEKAPSWVLIPARFIIQEVLTWSSLKQGVFGVSSSGDCFFFSAQS